MCANLEVAWAKWSVGCSGVYLQERVQVGASKFSEKASSLIFICYRAHSSTGPGWNKSNLYEQTWKFPEWAGGCCMSDFRLQSSVRVCLNTRDGSLLLCFSGDLPVWLLARCEMVAGRNWTWMCRSVGDVVRRAHHSTTTNVQCRWWCFRKHWFTLYITQGKFRFQFLVLYFGLPYIAQGSFDVSGIWGFAFEGSGFLKSRRKEWTGLTLIIWELLKMCSY